MNNNLQLFRFENQQLRILKIDDRPYLIAKDVADILGYKNYRDAISKHIEAEDKGIVKLDTLGSKQNKTVVNESSLYSLFFQVNNLMLKCSNGR